MKRRDLLLHLRQDGKPIPTNDIWIAAFALGSQAALFTSDSHFNQIDGLRVISDRDDFTRLG